MKLRLGLLLVAACIGLGAQNISFEQPAQATATTIYVNAQGDPIQAVSEKGVVPSSSFARGSTELQKQPCAVDYTKIWYRSEIISKEEIIFNLKKAGANDQQANLLRAIAHAESGSQINCHGDDYSPYYGQAISGHPGWHWGESYGLFQIRTIKEKNGTGDCRDKAALQDNIEKQAQCAWEISGQGASYRPWSVYLNGKYKKYL